MPLFETSPDTTYGQGQGSRGQASSSHDAPETLQQPLTGSSVSVLSNADLIHLRFLANQLLRDRGVQYLPPALPQWPTDEFDNAKYEQIACVGLKPKHNGSAADLIPILNLIHIRRQNESWYPAGTTVDIVQQLSKVATSDVENREKQIWDSPTVAIDRHTRDTASFRRSPHQFHYQWVLAPIIKQS